jgi:hypothetical protein
MKTYNAAILALILFLASCSSPTYLPHPKEVGVNTYGSYMKVKLINGKKVIGELLAIDDKELFILTSSLKNPETKSIVKVKRADLKKFRLQWGKPNSNYYPMPFLLSLVTLSHGVWLLISLPINLITSIAVIATAESDFSYTDKDISLNDLRKFARFPNGFPEGVNLEDIK